MNKLTTNKILTTLCLLLTVSLTACGQATESHSDAGTASTTETTAETTAMTTSAATEPSSETELPETQPETMEAPAETTTAAETVLEETTAAVSQEDAFYQMIADTLVPQWGLSDLAGFDEDGNADQSYLVKAIPAGTQGIVSAYVQDFDGNGTEECLIVRVGESAYILDLYDVNGAMLGTWVAHWFTPDNYNYATDLTIYLVDNYLVVERYQIKMPGYSSYGTETQVYKISEADGISMELFFGGTRSPMNGCVLYVNEETIVGDESMEGAAFDPLDAMLREELGTLGMQVEGLHFGWDVGEDLNYGIKADFLGDAVMLFEDGYADGLTVFQDYTQLRERIAAE